VQKYAHVKGSNPSSPFPLVKIKIMASQKKRKDQKHAIDTIDVQALQAIPSHFSVQKSPSSVWNVERINYHPEKESDRFNKLYFETKSGFHEASNILSSNIPNSRKDKLISDSILKFCLSRNMTLTGPTKFFHNLPLTEFTNTVYNQEEDVRMIDFFFCFLYTYQNLNCLALDNKIPSSLLEQYFLIYLGVQTFLDDNLIDIENPKYCALDTIDYYLCNTNYFEYTYIRKYYVQKKEETIRDFVHLLKTIGMLESQVGSYYFISVKAKNFAINHLNGTKSFSFPSLTAKKGLYINHRDVNYFEPVNDIEKSTLILTSPYDFYKAEYLVFCKKNSLALAYRSFFEYIENDKKLNMELA